MKIFSIEDIFAVALINIIILNENISSLQCYSVLSDI